MVNVTTTSERKSRDWTKSVNNKWIECVVRWRNGQGIGDCSVVFFNVFIKMRKVTISFIMSFRPHGTTRLPLDGFS